MRLVYKVKSHEMVTACRETGPSTSGEKFFRVAVGDFWHSASSVFTSVGLSMELLRRDPERSYAFFLTVLFFTL